MILVGFIFAKNDENCREWNMAVEKTLKEYCKEAKKRLKTGFWENYQKDLNDKICEAERIGVSENKIKEYYIIKAKQEIKISSNENEEFYQKVKKILLEEGEVSNAIGRLTDKAYFETLSYDEKQRYTLSLSEKYLKAVERFNKEREVEGN